MIDRRIEAAQGTQRIARLLWASGSWRGRQRLLVAGDSLFEFRGGRMQDAQIVSGPADAAD